MLTVGAGLALSGCANFSGLNLFAQTVSLVGRGRGQGYTRTREEIDALPYAQLGLSQGEGPKAVLVLAEAQGEELSWVSANRVQIVTYRNRVIRTTGLKSDFARTALESPDLWDRYDPATRGAGEGQSLRTVAIEPGRQPPAQVQSGFEVEGEEQIAIHGERIDTLRVRERIDVPAWRWQATNTWWLSREGRIAWRSIQHLTPDQPPLNLEILKRPA